YPAMFGQGVKAIPYPELLLTLPQTFPTVTQKVDFQVERGFYINFAPYNGAPNLVEQNQIDHRTKVFSFTDNDREKEKTERYEYDYRSEPTIKFQVVYTSPSYQDDVDLFLSKPFVPLSVATPDMVQKVATRIALENNDQAETDAKEIIKYMKQKHNDVKDPVQYMKYAYYYFRYMELSKPASTRYQYENNPDHVVSLPTFAIVGKGGRSAIQQNASSYYSNRRNDLLNSRVTDDFFIKTMGLVCRDRKIDYDFLLTVPRNLGTLDNLILADELSWVLRVKGVPEACFYTFDRFKNPNEGIGTLEGADAYVIVPSKNSRMAKLDKQIIPSSKYTDNTSLYVLNVNLNAAMDGGASITRAANLHGLNKNYYYPEVLLEDDYENADIERYRNSRDELTDKEFVAKIRNNKNHDEAARKLKDSYDEESKARMDKMKNLLSNDYTVDSYDDFELTADGRELDSTNLIFNETFKVKDLMKKVGPNFMVNIGSLIGTQTNIKDTELDRQTDIYFN
ncbi:MAG TPA: hypothetical protein VN922_17670, partial [Bacteroidia bacterium]|nr:hypothetical protein [Bacteroidia bacterium]